MTGDKLMTVDVLYHQVDRIGRVPQVNEPFPCDEAPEGKLLVVERQPIVRAGRKVGWTVTGRC